MNTTESQYVHRVYDLIAKDFDRTRYSVWSCVKAFLDGFPARSVIADWGMGNGKNMLYRSDLDMYGFDTCNEFVQIARNKQLNVTIGNCLDPPFKEILFDGIISIAVLHHVSSRLDRTAIIHNIIRALKPGGKALITVWAKEQAIKDTWIEIGNNDFMVPWHSSSDKKTYKRYYHLFTKQEIADLYAPFTATGMIRIQNMFYEMDNWCVVFEKC